MCFSVVLLLDKPAQLQSCVHSQQFLFVGIGKDAAEQIGAGMKNWLAYDIVSFKTVSKKCQSLPVNHLYLYLLLTCFPLAIPIFRLTSSSKLFLGKALTRRISD